MSLFNREIYVTVGSSTVYYYSVHRNTSSYTLLSFVTQGFISGHSIVLKLKSCFVRLKDLKIQLMKSYSCVKNHFDRCFLNAKRFQYLLFDLKIKRSNFKTMDAIMQSERPQTNQKHGWSTTNSGNESLLCSIEFTQDLASCLRESQICCCLRHRCYCLPSNRFPELSPRELFEGNTEICESLCVGSDTDTTPE